MSGWWLCTRSSLSVCMYVINFCKQYISKSNLWIFTKFIADSLHTTLEMINVWCRSHSTRLRTNDPIFAISHFLFRKWCKRRPLVNHIVMTVHHDRWQASSQCSSSANSVISKWHHPALLWRFCNSAPFISEWLQSADCTYTYLFIEVGQETEHGHSLNRYDYRFLARDAFVTTNRRAICLSVCPPVRLSGTLARI